MSDTDDFPMLPENFGGNPPRAPRYLAEAIYRLYVECYGNYQSLETIEKRGGFGWLEIRKMAELRERRLVRRKKT